MQLALERQKMKEEADKHSKVVQKEKIRQEYQRALDQRATKQVCSKSCECHAQVVNHSLTHACTCAWCVCHDAQHQLLEELENQHDERLQLEKERKQHALELVEQLREEEKHVALRLQALKFHQEFIQRSDHSSSGPKVVVVAPRLD